MPEDEGTLVSTGMWDRLAHAWDVHVDWHTEVTAAAKRRGGDSLDYAILDVADPDLPDGEVDGLLARWVYMLLPDPATTFAVGEGYSLPGRALVLAAR